MIEPGRWLVGPAGLLLASVVLTKGDERFVVLDAAMNDLVRPAMYDAWHGIVPLASGNAVGPVREVVHENDRGLVFEVAFEGLARSPRHKSGIAMRFPRISRLRWDKPPAEADRLERLETMIEQIEQGRLGRIA